MTEGLVRLEQLVERHARELRASEERFRNVISKLADGIIIVNREGIVRFANPTAEYLFGRGTEELLGTSFGFPVVAGETAEIDVIRKDGQTTVAEMRVVETEWEGETAYLASLRDITERKRAEEGRAQLIREQAARAEAEAASRAKDEFLMTLSHELRTPLNAILGWMHLLGGGKLDQETYACALETIERNALAQAKIIGDILDLSQAVNGKLRLEAQPVELVPVIKAAIATALPAAEAKDIRLQEALNPSAGPVSGDPSRLQQVVWNLLSNAIKFTPRGGRVQVSLARIDSQVEIKVSDTGVGIKPEFLPHLFERFRQADGSTSRSYGGLGVGLSLVKHLVELHGGSVQAESPGEGQGATFIVRLPRCEQI